MFTKALLTAAAFAASAIAQTATDCDPTKTDCPAAPAFGSQKLNCDFTKGACAGFKVADGTNISYSAQEGALFAIENVQQGPTLISEKYIFFGEVEFTVQAAPGSGIVTSVVLESQDLDEIDFEWIGSDYTQVQSNYFGKGDTTTYDRGAFHTIQNPQTQPYSYKITWNQDTVVWTVNNVNVRTLTYAEAKGGSRYPQTPCKIKIGTWVAGRPDASPGTVEWAGGMADWSKAPFDAWYKSISITDYAGGKAPATGNIKEYVYGDRSGSYQSIKVVQG